MVECFAYADRMFNNMRIVGDLAWVLSTLMVARVQAAIQ
jgi:hypothetical protein